MLLFSSSKRSRTKLIKRLMNRHAMSEAHAEQVAWATFPFNDLRRPGRAFEKKIRETSWTYVRDTAGSDVLTQRAVAARTLGAMADLAYAHGERYYRSVYERIADRDPADVPPAWDRMTL
jgi:hypothetical protein